MDNSYFAWADSKGRDVRIRAQSWNASRARMLIAFQEYELGAITMFMGRRELQARVREGMWAAFFPSDRNLSEVQS